VTVVDFVVVAVTVVRDTTVAVVVPEATVTVDAVLRVVVLVIEDVTVTSDVVVETKVL